MKILGYIFISSLLLLSSATATAQTKAGNNKEENTFAFKGVAVSADLYGYINTLFDDFTSSEVAVQANLGNRFFPIVEIGYGSTDVTDDLTGI